MAGRIGRPDSYERFLIMARACLNHDCYEALGQIRADTLVVGGEKRGISRQLLEASDGIVRVDYGREFRGSLSASAACAVLAFEIFRQNRSRKKG